MTQAFNRDCIEAMREFPDKFFDLAVVDPPYGGGAERERERERENCTADLLNGTDATVADSADGLQTTISAVKETGGSFRKHEVPRTGGIFSQPEIKCARTGAGHNKYNQEPVKCSHWDIAPPKEYFQELARVSKNQIIWGGNYFDLPATRCFLVWRKSNIPLEGFSMASIEYAWTSFNDNARMFEYPSNGGSGRESRFHPTQKPIALYEWIYSHYAEEGFKILDTHLGSGSSRIAAHNCGLDFWGYEIDKYYFALEEERFEAHSAQQNLFGEMNG